MTLVALFSPPSYTSPRPNDPREYAGFRTRIQDVMTNNSEFGARMANVRQVWERMNSIPPGNKQEMNQADAELRNASAAARAARLGITPEEAMRQIISNPTANVSGPVPLPPVPPSSCLSMCV